MASNITIYFAFTAGLISFLAPCVLPIIPGLLLYLAGGSSDSDNSPKRKDVFINSIFFVLGFSFAFSLVGVLLNSLLSHIAYDVQIWLARIGGLVIIFFGFYLTGLIKLRFLEREHKFRIKIKFKSRYLTSFLFGLAFAVGWSPCVGAILGAIFGLAATQPGSAFGLLLAYSIGLGLPFLLVGMFALPAKRLITKYAYLTKYINFIFGLLIIIIGVLVFTQKLASLVSFEFINRLLL